MSHRHATRAPGAMTGGRGGYAARAANAIEKRGGTLAEPFITAELVKENKSSFFPTTRFYSSSLLYDGKEASVDVRERVSPVLHLCR